MFSVTFNSIELVNSTYHLQYAKHQPVPDREIVMERLSNRDGEVIISNYYRSKRILVRGTIVGTSASDLQTKVDVFKELFSREAKDLDITPTGGSARRYVATCARHSLDQDYYNITFLPWEAEFIVPLGYGKSTSPTNHSDDNITSSPHASSVTVTGSKGCKPIITLTIVNESTMTVLKFENTTTGQYIQITRAFADAEVITIDCEAMTCKVGATAVDFTGVFPDFDVGANGYTITVTDGGAFDIDLDIDYYSLYL